MDGILDDFASYNTTAKPKDTKDAKPAEKPQTKPPVKKDDDDFDDLLGNDDMKAPAKPATTAKLPVKKPADNDLVAII
jgi:hypothetical protein